MSALPLPGNRDAPSECDWRLLDLRETRRLIVGWTLLYGGGSWLLEYGYASLGATPGSFAAAGKNAVYALVWAPLLFGAVWLVDRWPVHSVFDVRRVVLHLGAITIAPFLWGAATYYLCLMLVPGWQPWGVWRMYLKTFMGVLYVCMVVIGICHLAHWMRRARERELAAVRDAEAATRAQMHVLSLELHPHFLRNALHSMSALLYSDPARAGEALGELRSMLEHAVRTASVTEVTLLDELATLRRYARMQELRFGDRLSLVWQIAPDVFDAAVPNYLLQPLLENAIKFSVEALAGCRTIAVAAERVDTDLVLRVVDDGIGPRRATPRVPSARSRRGLANVRARLAHLYRDHQNLTITAGVGGRGTAVEVRIPFRRLRAGELGARSTEAAERVLDAV